MVDPVFRHSGIFVHSATFNDLFSRRTQQIGEVVRLLEFNGLIMPSAGYNRHNAVLFRDRVPLKGMAVVLDHGLIDWTQAG